MVDGTPEEGIFYSLINNEDIYVILSFYGVICFCAIWTLILIAWYMCRDPIAMVLIDSMEEGIERYCTNSIIAFLVLCFLINGIYY